ncbi:MAG: TonB-dependent siderophore receptor [Sphingobium sp.]
MALTENRCLAGWSRIALVASAFLTPQPSIAAAGAGVAAEADTRSDDAIIVTGLREAGTAAGTKTATPLIETPQTITVISMDELKRRNAISLNQALGYVAGVSTNQRGGTVSRYDQMYIRGFTPGVYLDGMRLLAGPYSMPQTDINRIDQIDVVKGPASVLYGSSPPGGLINLTSKMPEADASGAIEAQLGNYNSQRVVADLNQPLDKEGRLRARIVGGWQKADGFTRLTQAERWHVSPSISFVPSDRTSLTIIAAYQHAPSGGGYSGVPAYGSVLPNPAGTLPPNINTGDPGYEVYDHKQKAVSVLFRREVDEHLTLRSNVRYQNNKLSYRQIYVGGFATTGTGLNRNTDYSLITRGGGGADEDFDTITADNSLNATCETAGIRHNVLAGVDFQKITGENVQQFNTGETTNPLTSIPNLSLFNPVYGGQVPAYDLKQLSAAYTNSYSLRRQIGFYIQDQLTIGNLHLIASGRWDEYHQRTVNLKLATNNLTSLTQHAFTMRLGALYEFDFGLSPYFSYSESFEPQTGTDSFGNPFVPTTGVMYEAGLKYQPRGTKLLLTLSAYDLRRQNVPVSDPLAGQGGRLANGQIQVGEVKIRGIELEARGELRPGLDVIFAGTYMDPTVTEGAPATAARAATVTALGTTGTPTTTGTAPLGTPDWQGSGFLSYDFAKGGAAGAIAGLSLGAGVRYVAGSWGSTSYKVVNSVTTFEAFKTKAFTLFDAMIGYDLGQANESLKGLSFAFNAQNLFDKRHVSACPFSNSCYYGSARTVTGSLRYNW